jgi:hypothetical protein
MLAVFSPEEAANRETTGERMKIREYRNLETWSGHFPHRKTDTRGRATSSNMTQVIGVFVSERTNKRHHHQGCTQLLTECGTVAAQGVCAI